MWKLMGFLVVVSLVTSLAMFHSASPAQARADKQLICHVSDSQGAHIIEVAEPAVPAHLRNHGDCLINSTDRALIGEACDPTDANDNDICDIQP